MCGAQRLCVSSQDSDSRPSQVPPHTPECLSSPAVLLAARKQVASTQPALGQPGHVAYPREPVAPFPAQREAPTCSPRDRTAALPCCVACTLAPAPGAASHKATARDAFPQGAYLVHTRTPYPDRPPPPPPLHAHPRPALPNAASRTQGRRRADSPVQRRSLPVELPAGSVSPAAGSPAAGSPGGSAGSILKAALGKKAGSLRSEESAERDK